MPIIHHPTLRQEMDVPDAQVPIWTATRSPWKLGPLKRKRTRPTAATPSPTSEDTDPNPNTPDPED